MSGQGRQVREILAPQHDDELLAAFGIEPGKGQG
jgi:hypothetical protein